MMGVETMDEDRDLLFTLYIRGYGKMEYPRPLDDYGQMVIEELYKRIDSKQLVLHNIDGPAVIGAPAKAFDSEYYLDGEPIKKRSFYKIVREARALPPELRLTDPRRWVREDL